PPGRRQGRGGRAAEGRRPQVRALVARPARGGDRPALSGPVAPRRRRRRRLGRRARMIRITREGWLAYACALAALIAHQAAKFAVLGLPEAVAHPVVWPLAFTRTWNDGVSFGLLQTGGAGRWLFVAFSLGVATVLGVWANKSTRLPAIGLGLVMG